MMTSTAAFVRAGRYGWRDITYPDEARGRWLKATDRAGLQPFTKQEPIGPYNLEQFRSGKVRAGGH